jgi:hypothetical protein
MHGKELTTANRCHTDRLIKGDVTVYGPIHGDQDSLTFGQRACQLFVGHFHILLSALPKCRGIQSNGCGIVKHFRENLAIRYGIFQGLFWSYNQLIWL